MEINCRLVSIKQISKMTRAVTPPWKNSRIRMWAGTRCVAANYGCVVNSKAPHCKKFEIRI